MLLSNADNVIDDAIGLLSSQDPRTFIGAAREALTAANDSMYQVRDLELELGRKKREFEETVHKYETVQKELQELNSALQASQTEAEAANELAVTLKERADMLQKSLEATQSEAENFKKAFQDSQAESETANELVNTLQEKATLLESSLEASKKELQELQDSFQAAQKESSSANELAETLKSKVESLESTLQEKEEALEDDEVTEALLAAKVELEEKDCIRLYNLWFTNTVSVSNARHLCLPDSIP